MPLFTNESLDALRQRIDLVDALSAHLDLKASGSTYKGLCPFHDEKTPSFMIQRGDSHYHCYGCGAHGDAIQFLMEYLKMSFVEAVESLAERFHVHLEKAEESGENRGPNKAVLKEALEMACNFYHFCLLHVSEGRQALEYLHDRGIDSEFIEQFQVGVSPENPTLFRKMMHSKGISDEVLREAGLLRLSQRGVVHDFFSDRIMFPIREGSGAVIGFSARKYKEETFGGKYINTPETALFKKSRILFGLNYSRRRIAKERKAIIVEGQVDALRLIQKGFNLTVAGLGTAFGEESTGMIPGSILKGRIVEITKDHVVVDVGLKSEGLIPINEFSDPSVLVLDGEVEVLLDQAEDENGQIVLSREKAERQRQWEHISEHCEEGSIVTGRVLRKVKGGLIVDIGMEAFLPGSQIDNKRIKNLDDYLGETYEFKILKINIERKNVVVSRRELLEAERISKKAELLGTIKEGDIREGVVKNITDFGVFLDLDGIDGLLHITDMTWKRIKHPSEMVKLGDKLEVMILSIDRDKGRVALGLKQKGANPWDQIEQKYPPGTRIKGKIVNLLPYGAFVEIEPGIEGLIHVSEMSWVKNVTDPSEIVNKGDEVEAIVLSIQKDEGKISLGIKQTEHNPWDDVEKKYAVGTQVKAEVKSLTNYGAFVELEPGVEGLIHISDLSWIKKLSHPSEILSKGDSVTASVISVDRESKKITLGIKQLTQNPWETIEKTMPVGSLVTGKVTKTTAFGAFIELESGIEGLIHVTELSDQPFGKVEDVVSKGQDVTAKVIKLDPEHKKIALSIKECLIDQNQSNYDDIVVTRKNKEEVEEEA